MCCIVYTCNLQLNLYLFKIFFSTVILFCTLIGQFPIVFFVRSNNVTYCTIHVRVQYKVLAADVLYLFMLQPGLGISILPKYQNCFQWFFLNTEIQAKPNQYYTEISKFNPSQFRYYTELPKFKQSQFRFIRNWQRFTQSTFGKRSHAHTNKLMSSTILYTLYEYALQLTAHSVLQIDFAIICQWQFSRLFPNRSDTVNAVRGCWQAWKQSFTYMGSAGF